EDAQWARGPLNAFLHAPVVAWFPGDRYLVLGGFVTALIPSLLLFMPIRWTVIWFRETIQPKGDQYRIIRWWRGFFLTKILGWVFVGSRKTAREPGESRSEQQDTKGRKHEDAKRGLRTVFVLSRFRPFRVRFSCETCVSIDGKEPRMSSQIVFASPARRA